MKFELKTENENYSKSISQFLGIVFFITLIIIISDLTLKLGVISRNHKIEYNCMLLSVEKSKPHFKKLSRISNLKSKKRIWELCSEFIK